MHYQVSSTYKYSINFLKKNLLVTNIQSPNKHGTLSLPEYILHLLILPLISITK